MKDKVLARLKAKHPGVNLSKTRLDKISDYVVKKIPAEATDEEIDTIIDDLNDFQPFADIAKSDDRQRLADKKAKDEADAKAKADAEAAAAAGKTGKDDEQDDTPKWAKKLIDDNAALRTEIESIKKGKTIDTRTQKFLDTIKDASDEYKTKELKKFNKMAFDSDEDFEEYLEDAGTDAISSKQAEVNGAVGTGKVIKGAPDRSGKKEASKEEVDNVLDKIM
jgi:hypothetical protein